MTDHPSEEREQILSERFDRGVRTGCDDSDREILQDYERIGQILRAYPVHDPGREALVRRLQYRCGASRWRIMRKLFAFPATGRAALVPACAILCTFIYSLSLFALPLRTPVTSVKYTEETARLSGIASYLFKKRLQRGSLVTMPRGNSIILSLADGSTVSCKPETQLAIDFSSLRRIRLNSGVITVQAALMPNRPMVVETPLSNITVVGTTFRVEIVRQKK